MRTVANGTTVTRFSIATNDDRGGHRFPGHLCERKTGIPLG